MAIKKITANRSNRKFYVDWWFTDHCNYNCSYCHEHLKRGWIPFVDIKDCKKTLNQLSDFIKKSNLQLDIDLHGGEITQWPHLYELLEYIKSLGADVGIQTNGSQSLEDFSRNLDFLDRVTLNFHPEYSHKSHFINLIKKTTDKNVYVYMNLNMLPNKFEELENFYNLLKNRWPKLGINKKMLFDDPISKTQPLQYQEAQLSKFKRQFGSIIIEEDDQRYYTDHQTMIIEKQNLLKGAQCNVGKEQIIIDAYGTVRRGHCRAHGNLGQIGDDIDFNLDAIQCHKPSCDNAFDILATKIIEIKSS